MTQADEGGHSSWQASPLHVAEYGTRNFYPPNQDTKQTSSNQETSVWRRTYKDGTVSYHIASTTKKTSTFPATTTVEERGYLTNLQFSVNRVVPYIQYS